MGAHSHTTPPSRHPAPKHRFAFGKTPPPQEQDEAFATACFAQCPSRRRAFTDANARPGDCTNIAIARDS